MATEACSAGESQILTGRDLASVRLEMRVYELAKGDVSQC